MNTAPAMTTWIGLFALALAALLSGCGSTPVRGPQSESAITFPAGGVEPGARAVHVAYTQLGTPYRYGGSDPSGFDCSGLVQYAYGSAGIFVPRTTSQQLRHARPVSLSALRPGDLVFFRLSKRKTSHVGIYAGGGRFIHAPSTGKEVSYARLDNPYWRARVVGAGRVY